MVRLSEGEKCQLFGLGTRGGWSQDELVTHFYVNQFTVSNYWEKNKSLWLCERPSRIRPPSCHQCQWWYSMRFRPCHSKTKICCEINSIHTTNARFLARLSRFASMQSISRYAGDILGRAVSIDPAPTQEDLLLHLQFEWANIPKGKIIKLMRSITAVCICIEHKVARHTSRLTDVWHDPTWVQWAMEAVLHMAWWPLSLEMFVEISNLVTGMFVTVIFHYNFDVNKINVLFQTFCVQYIYDLIVFSSN